MNSAVVSTWNAQLIALSYVISVLGSFVALRAASLMRLPDGRISRVNTLTGWRWAALASGPCTSSAWWR